MAMRIAAAWTGRAALMLLAAALLTGITACATEEPVGTVSVRLVASGTRDDP